MVRFVFLVLGVQVHKEGEEKFKDFLGQGALKMVETRVCFVESTRLAYFFRTFRVPLKTVTW